MIRDDLTHDYYLVNTFQETITKHLADTSDIALSTFYSFSDGCSSQYKSEGSISDIGHAKGDFGYNICHNFSSARHGKGASDGESGVVKRHPSDAIETGNIRHHQLCEYIRESITKDSTAGKCCIPFRRTIFLGGSYVSECLVGFFRSLPALTLMLLCVYYLYWAKLKPMID